jgi:hypothetical protein
MTYIIVGIALGIVPGILLHYVRRGVRFLEAGTKELLAIRTALNSVHDLATPELLMRKWERDRRQRRGW